MNQKTIFRGLCLSVIALLVLSIGTTMTVKGEDEAGEPFADDELVFFIDSSVNVTAEISSPTKTQLVQLSDWRVVVGGAGNLPPELLLSEFEGAALPLSQNALRAYYDYLNVKNAGTKDAGYAVLDLKDQLLSVMSDSVDNDSAEATGMSEAFVDKFSIEDDLEADTLYDFNSSNVCDWGVMEPQYRYLEDKLADNATETDFIKESQREEEDEYNILSTGVEDLEEAMFEVMAQNIAANQSTLPEYVHITWYNASGTNQSTYMSEAFSDRVRQAEADYSEESAAATFTYYVFGFKVFETKGIVPLSFFYAQPVMGAVSIRPAFGKVVSFGKLLVSKVLPKVPTTAQVGKVLTQIQDTVKGTITKAQNVAKGVVHNVLKAPQAIVKNVATGVQTFTHKVVTGVQKLATDVATGAGQFVNKAVGGVVGTVQKVVGGVVSFIPLLLIGGIVGLLIIVVLLFFFLKQQNSPW